MSRPLRVVVIDDDAVARDELLGLLPNGDAVEVSTAHDAEALGLGRGEDPDPDVLLLVSARRLEALLRRRMAGTHYARRLLVRDGSRVAFVDVDRINWIEAAGNYVRLHVDSEVHVLRSGIGDIEAKLDPARFARIHRSTIVNLDRVDEIRSEEGERYAVILGDGTDLTLSRSYRDLLRRDAI